MVAGGTVLLRVSVGAQEPWGQDTARHWAVSHLWTSPPSPQGPGTRRIFSEQPERRVGDLSVLPRAIFPVVMVVFPDMGMRTVNIHHHSWGPSEERPRETRGTHDSLRLWPIAHETQRKLGDLELWPDRLTREHTLPLQTGRP